MKFSQYIVGDIKTWPEREKIFEQYVICRGINRWLSRPPRLLKKLESYLWNTQSSHGLYDHVSFFKNKYDNSFLIFQPYHSMDVVETALKEDSMLLAYCLYQNIGVAIWETDRSWYSPGETVLIEFCTNIQPNIHEDSNVRINKETIRANIPFDIKIYK